MPPITHLIKKKEAMEPYPTSSSASAHLDLVTPINTCDPPPPNLEKPGPLARDIKAF